MSGAVVTMHGDVATSDGRRWTGGPGSLGLGTSGSGDVLAGLIGGLGARCRESAQAACWGTYLHGAAGERLARRIGPIGYLARELADEAPCVLAELAP
jgi:NAD(P)H-hydrate repair Nnr-like enzyme with NAD(P)H-hydrate dehydratase domain